MGRTRAAKDSCSAVWAGPACTVLVFSWVNSKRDFENPLWEGRAELGNHWLDGTDNLLFLSIKSSKAPQVSLTVLPLWCLWINQGVNMNTLGWAAMKGGRVRERESGRHKDSHCNTQPSTQNHCTHSHAQPLFLLQTKGSEFQLQSEWSRRQRGTSVYSECVSVEHTQHSAWEDGADVWRTWKSFALNMWHGFSQKKLCLTTNKYLMLFLLDKSHSTWPVA